jgi:DNA-binding NarL/FixJ family response regulator
VIDVLLVDDHALMRSGLRGVIAGSTDVQVVGMASDGAEAVSAVATTNPHVVLMDLSMPGMDGVTATRQITELYPDVAVVILTSYSDEQRVLEAMDAGAIGYVLKDTDPLDPRVARTILHSRRAAPTASELTEREEEVLALVGRGLANKQIARALDIREGTVKAHLTSVFQRIGVRDRTSAALWARTNLPQFTEPGR